MDTFDEKNRAVKSRATVPLTRVFSITRELKESQKYFSIISSLHPGLTCLAV
jgi:hypothetical protein